MLNIIQPIQANLYSTFIEIDWQIFQNVKNINRNNTKRIQREYKVLNKLVK